jgi:hypothetical protein
MYVYAAKHPGLIRSSAMMRQFTDAHQDPLASTLSIRGLIIVIYSDNPTGAIPFALFKNKAR